MALLPTFLGASLAQKAEFIYLLAWATVRLNSQPKNSSVNISKTEALGVGAREFYGLKAVLEFT